MALQIENISFGYDKNKKILNNISLSVNQGEVLGILGPNGTGKTTFIKCINHILSPDSGEILFDGQKLDNMTPKDIAKIIAYVPQYTGDFFAMNVIDAVMMGRLPYTQNQYSHQDRTIVFNILRQMQLENFAFRSIKAMSGGERPVLWRSSRNALFWTNLPAVWICTINFSSCKQSLIWPKPVIFL